MKTELLQIAADEIVIVGDNWDWDILGASKTGMWQVWVAPDRHDRTDPPDRYLGRVSAFQHVPAFIAANWNARGQDAPLSRPRLGGWNADGT